MARKFLYTVAILIVLMMAVLLGLRLFADELTRFATVPSAAFTPQPALAGNVYADPAMWISRPGKSDDPARFLPEGAARGAPVAAAVFFIHPTSYLTKKSWNAPLDDAESRNRAELFVGGMASPFGDAAEIWAPRYRQAAFGAFLTDRADARAALDLAYGDVLAAFDWFIGQAAADRPIVLAGHSQGAMHLMRLMQDRIAGTALAKRVAAAYVVGWPVSAMHDLPAMGLPACSGPQQPGCVMSWESFGEPAEPPEVLPGYVGATGLDGQPRLATPPICTNPLTGGAGAAASASANLGTLVPADNLTSGTLAVGLVSARCDNGLLLIGDPPKMGPYVLPGNNYHLYDIPLFWANLRADVAQRVEAWRATR